MAAAASSWVFTSLNTRHMNVAAQQCFKIKFHFSFLQLFSVKLNIHRFKHESPVCYVPLRDTCPLWCVQRPSHFSKVTVSWWNMLFLYKDADMNVKINDCFLKMKKICVLRMNLLLKMNILGVFFKKTFECHFVHFSDNMIKRSEWKNKNRKLWRKSKINEYWLISKMWHLQTSWGESFWVCDSSSSRFYIHLWKRGEIFHKHFVFIWKQQR